MVNVICRTQEFGKEIKVEFYTRLKAGEEHRRLSFFFSGKQPKNGQLVLIKDVETLPKQDENKVYKIADGNWVKPVLEDFINMENELSCYNFKPDDYRSKEYEEFTRQITPKFVETLARYLSEFETLETEKISLDRTTRIVFRFILLRLTQQPAEGIFEKVKRKSKIKNEVEAEKIKEDIKFLQRTAVVLQWAEEVLGSRLLEEIEQFYLLNDSGFIRAAKLAQPQKIIEMAKKCRSSEVRHHLEKIFLKKITDDNNRVHGKDLAVLEEFAKQSSAADYSNIRWVLPGNAKNMTIDISKSRVERKARLSELVQATRVGNISNSEHVLIIHPLKSSEKKIYIKGGKKLKRQVRNAGGMLKKYGNTLTVSEGLSKELMEIERINALALLNPLEVIKLLKSRGIKTSGPEKLAANAKTNYKEGRKLADTAVELLYHIDPIAARKLIKQFGI